MSDVGRALPYIAPAFVLLSFIISVEKKAREADAKCNDLLDRITFMLSNVSVLRHVKVMDATRRVIDRMNNVLKDAASLIQAYRKQSKVARRLNTGNLDKFTSCARAVNDCANDLMISLQIHQTGQLDVLTRSVPIDPEDEAAQTFVTRHGGLNAVKQNPELVKEFAKEMHITIDEDSMHQLNTTLSDLMRQNQSKLQSMLSGNISTAIVDGIRELAAQTAEGEKEQQLNCVQCDMPYRISSNGPKSCNFHKAAYSSWNKLNPCCGIGHPCQFGYHHDKHHSTYPYGNFFDYAEKINNYVDTVDEWAMVEDKSLVVNETQKASVGKLLRWVSRGSLIEEPTILISVGTIWHTEKYYFNTFTAADLEAASNVARVTGHGMIFRTSASHDEYAMAEWDLSTEGKIAGVRITAKAATSETPFARICPLNIVTCAKSGDVINLSDGGMRSYLPRTPYVVPETVRVGPELSDKPIRHTRTDFKTRTTPALPILIQCTSEPPLKPNRDFGAWDSDNFYGVISVFNKSPAGSVNPISIASVKASYRMIGDERYSPVKSMKLLKGEVLPVTIDARQSWAMAFEIVIPRTEEDSKLGVRWFNRAFLARKRPLRVEFTLGDIEGEECSLVIEHVFDPLFPLEKKKEDDLAFFYFDDCNLWNRNYVRVTKDAYNNEIIMFNGIGVEAVRLQKAVYHAMKTGETEVDLEIGAEKCDGAWEWRVWALVDSSCRTVYAFKVLIQEGKKVTKKTMGCLGYVLCPEYGDVVGHEKRPVQYAIEKVKSPQLEAPVLQEFVIDDSIDDFVPEPEPAAAGAVPVDAAASTSTAQFSVPEEFTARLASIDSNLTRIATALELLVSYLAPKPTAS